MYAKIKVDSNDSLPLEKKLTFCNDIIILIKSVSNKEKNTYYNNSILLEKGLHEVPKNNNNK